MTFLINLTPWFCTSSIVCQAVLSGDPIKYIRIRYRRGACLHGNIGVHMCRSAIRRYDLGVRTKLNYVSMQPSSTPASNTDILYGSPDSTASDAVELVQNQGTVRFIKNVKGRHGVTEAGGELGLELELLKDRRKSHRFLFADENTLRWNQASDPILGLWWTRDNDTSQTTMVIRVMRREKLIRWMLRATPTTTVSFLNPWGTWGLGQQTINYRQHSECSIDYKSLYKANWCTAANAVALTKQWVDLLEVRYYF